MRAAGDKKATTLRFSRETKSLLENISRVTKKSESSIAEEAVSEYAKRHGFNTRYVLRFSNECYVLFKHDGEITTVLDMHAHRGSPAPIQELQRHYAAQYNSPIELIEDP